MRFLIINNRLSFSFILVLLLASLSSFCLVGCQDDLYVIDSDEERPKDSFSVSILLTGMGVEPTRGIGEDCEDVDGQIGTSFENFIDVDDLYIMTFSIEEGQTVLTDDSKVLEVLWNGKSKGKPSDTSIYFDGSTTYLYTWLDSKIQDYKPDSGKDFCIVAVANFSKYGKTLSISKGMTLEALQNALKCNFSQGKNIPLFGVKKVNLKGYDSKIHNSGNPFTLKSGNSQSLWMLRAFSKVEIELSEDLLAKEESIGNITISSASIDRYASIFFVIPELDRMSGFYSTGGTGQVVAAPGNGFQSSANVGQKPLSFTIGEDKKSAVIYLPECELVSNEKPKITLSLSLGQSNQVFEFELKSCPEDSHYLCWQYLLRNHYYKFEVGVDLKIISATPQEWTDTFDNEFIFG